MGNLCDFDWLYFVVGNVYSQDGNHTLLKVCGSPNPKAAYFNENILTYLAMAIYSIVPFVAMFSMNIAIFIRLRQRDQQYNECAKLAVNGESKKVRHSNGMSGYFLPVCDYLNQCRPLYDFLCVHHYKSKFLNFL